MSAPSVRVDERPNAAATCTGPLTHLERLRRHWPEYLMEAAGLGAFMVSACVFGTLLGHPASPLVRFLPEPMARRAVMGLAMGLTAVSIIYSPWGRRSGAHLNPSVTLTFLRLGKVAPGDALPYVAAQFAGGVAGVLAASTLLGSRLADPGVRYVVTAPGPTGPLVALAAEIAISFLLMLVVLIVSNTPRLARFTGLAAGALVALYITFEAPISGMSMNPARTFGSDLAAGAWPAYWVYLAGPPLGMLLASEVYLRVRGASQVFCAKLQHDAGAHCIFCEERARRSEPPNF